MYLLLRRLTDAYFCCKERFLRHSLLILIIRIPWKWQYYGTFLMLYIQKKICNYHVSSKCHFHRAILVYPFRTLESLDIYMRVSWHGAKREYFCTFWMRAATWLRGFAGIVWWGSIMGREKRRDTYTHKKIVCHRAARYGTTTSGWSVVHINRKHQQCGNTNNPLRTNVLWYHKSREIDRLGSKVPMHDSYKHRNDVETRSKILHYLIRILHF